MCLRSLEGGEAASEFPQNLPLYGALCNVYVEVYSVYFNQLG